MEKNANKSLSDSDLSVAESTPKTMFGVSRSKILSKLKRKREEDIATDLDQFKNDMMEMIASKFSEHKTELEKIAPTLDAVRKSNSNIENSIAFLLVQNEEFKNKITSLENQAKDDKKYITLLEDKLEDLQIMSRKANFELRNVPKNSNETKEDLIEMVTCLSGKVGSTLNKTDISDIYRVRPKKAEEKNSPIVVETSSTLAKTDIIKACRTFNIRNKAKLCAKHLGLHVQEDTPIFVSEQLTAKQARLHFLARDLVKTKKYKFCWTAYGKVYVRKDENSKVEQIKSEARVQILHNI